MGVLQPVDFSTEAVIIFLAIVLPDSPLRWVEPPLNRIECQS